MDDWTVAQLIAFGVIIELVELGSLTKAILDVNKKNLC